MDNKEILEALQKPFKPEDIDWRIGRKSKDKTKGEVLAYMNARAVMERLDEAVGVDKWEISYTPIDMGTMTQETYKGTTTVPVKGFLATITLHLPDGDVSRSDGANCTDFEPFKGGLSGAFKRAASAFGIGRYLYKLPATWVPIDQYGNFEPPRMPEWALPEGYQYSTAQKSAPVQQYSQPKPSQPATNGNGEVMFTHGKYSGKPVRSVTDAGYLTWVVNKSNFSEDVKSEAAKVIADMQMKMYGDEPA